MFNWLKKLFGFELPDDEVIPRRPAPEGWYDDGKLPPVEDWECMDDRRVRRLRLTMHPVIPPDGDEEKED